MSHSTAHSSGSGSSEPSSCSCDTNVTSIIDGQHRVQMSLRGFMKAFFCPEAIEPQSKFTKASRFSSCIRAIKRPSFGLGSVCNLLNSMSAAYKDARGDDVQSIVFVDHSGALLSHHPEAFNDSQPHVIAVPAPVSNSWYADGQRRRTRASVKDKSPPNRSAIAWHHVLSTVLVDQRNDNQHPMDIAMDCLGSLNQARPDLPGCFGLTMTHLSCRILWSDAAAVYSTPDLSWDDPETVRALLGFVDRLYNPLAVDSSVRLADVSRARAAKFHCDRPVWLVSDDGGGVYWADQVLAVGRPWSRKSWVVRASRYKPPDAKTFSDCPPTVIKDSHPTVDQLCYSESAILEHIHADGTFPGVSLPVASFVVSNGSGYVQSVDVPRSGIVQRRKCRLILEGSGEDLYRCPSVLQFLMIMYDVIEVLRQLHQTRGVLHRDISLRNILCGPTGQEEPQHRPTNFIRRVLACKYPDYTQGSYGPTCVLIDYDNAFCQAISPESTRAAITGTAPFVASVITSRFRDESTLHPPPICALSGNALDCYIAAHGQEQYEKLSSLHDGLTAPNRASIPRERAFHGPRHDVESCCWLMMHFLSTALPVGGSREDTSTTFAQAICRDLEQHRIDSTMDFRCGIAKMRTEHWTHVPHPRLESFAPFLSSLSSLVDNVYELLEPPPDAYHLHEAVQRLLLREICRLLDTGEVIKLDIRHRRKLHSVFNYNPPQPTYAKRKRRSESNGTNCGRQKRCRQSAPAGQ